MADLLGRIKDAVEWASRSGHLIPLDLLGELAEIGIKTEGGYLRQIRAAIRALYSGQDTITGFYASLIGFFERQFTQAWFDGMAENGLKKSDMTPEWQDVLDNLIHAERDYIYSFAVDIRRAADAGTPIEPLLSRADLWATRYTEVKNVAVVTTASPAHRYEWVFGQTEDHCDDCAALAGVVATAEDWQTLRDTGIYPQSRQLACHGYNCDCEIKRTDKPLTPFARSIIGSKGR